MSYQISIKYCLYALLPTLVVLCSVTGAKTAINTRILSEMMRLIPEISYSSLKRMEEKYLPSCIDTSENYPCSPLRLGHPLSLTQTRGT